MKRRLGWIVLVFLLATALAAQLSVLWFLNQPNIPSGPAIGRQLPDVGLVSVDDSQPRSFTDVLRADTVCTVLVVVSPQCAFCRKMRAWWPAVYRAWLDTVRVPVRTAWVSAGDSSAMSSFYEGYDMPNVGRMRLLSDSGEALPRLGVYAVPTTYLLDRVGQLRVGILGAALPPVDSAKTICGAES